MNWIDAYYGVIPKFLDWLPQHLLAMGVTFFALTSIGMGISCALDRMSPTMVVDRSSEIIFYTIITAFFGMIFVPIAAIVMWAFLPFLLIFLVLIHIPYYITRTIVRKYDTSRS
jgi:hypothetical protein